MSALEGLLKWYGYLDQGSLGKINEYYDPQAFFKDPFNEVRGSDKIALIFNDMFENMQNPRFEFSDIIEKDNQAFVTWNFIFSFKGKKQVIHGSSHFKFNNQKVVYHRDYWDVGEELLLKIPFIGKMYGAFRRKVSST